MNDIFKNNVFLCRKNGVCSTNPILGALDAVIINEIRQIAFYTVKLKEFGYSNNVMAQEVTEYLSAVISDTGYSENAVINFYKNLENIHQKIKDFYIKKSKDLSYEIIEEKDNIKNTSVNALIEKGENIIKKYNNSLNSEKLRLYNLVILIAKQAATSIYKLSKYKKDVFEYCFETLRILSITNNLGTREEKLIRRIKEFSNVLYNIREELNYELKKKYGKIENIELEAQTVKEPSILVSGGDLDELDALLNYVKDKEISILIDSTMVLCYRYSRFKNDKNLKGIYFSPDSDYGFSKFKGAIYLTRNSDLGLDMAIRGNIFTTKEIPSDRAIKIQNDYQSLVDAAFKIKGRNKTVAFRYNPDKPVLKEKNLIVTGEMNENIKEKFKNYNIINFDFIYEENLIHEIINSAKTETISLYFSSCTIYTFDTVLSIINKGLDKIYFSDCSLLSINPHIKDSLHNDFNIEYAE